MDAGARSRPYPADGLSAPLMAAKGVGEMTAERPYSPETLADRWGCSAEKVRLMCRDGEIASFRLGKLIRIPATEVERVECLNIASSNIEENSASPTLTRNEAAFASRLARTTAESPKREPAKFGGQETARRATR